MGRRAKMVEKVKSLTQIQIAKKNLPKKTCMIFIGDNISFDGIIIDVINTKIQLFLFHKILLTRIHQVDYCLMFIQMKFLQ